MVHHCEQLFYNSRSIGRFILRTSTNREVDRTNPPQVLQTQTTPKGLLSLLNALDSIQQCWTITQMAHELVIADLDWWRLLFCSKSQKIDQLKLGGLQLEDG